MGMTNPGWSVDHEGNWHWYGDGEAPTTGPQSLDAFKKHLNDISAWEMRDGEVALKEGWTPPVTNELVLGPGEPNRPPRPAPDPFVPPPGGGSGGGIDWGSGGTTGVDPGIDIGDVDLSEYFKPQGFAGTNQEFYANQAANQRMQQFRNALREEVAFKRRANPAAPEPTDPWAWAGGAAQFAPTVGVGGDQVQAPPSLNADYGLTEGMTNRDIFNAISGGSDAFSADDLDWFNKMWEAGEGQWGADATNWGKAGSSAALINTLTGSPLTGPNRARMETLYNLIYSQAGPLDYGPGAPPPGYAAPVSVPGG